MNYKTKETLSQQYHIYRQHGIRAIPTLGNMAKTVEDIKIPPAGLRWGEGYKPYTDAFINPYLDAGYDGFASVMGRGWAALDFDTGAEYDDFRANFSYMEDTLRNNSGGKHLPHIWFRYPEDMFLETILTSGVDLKANRSYILCPPTEAHGRKYTNERGDLDSVIRLTRFQTEDIRQWVEAKKPAKPELLIAGTGQFIEDFVTLYEELRQDFGSRNYGYFFGLLRAQASGQRQAFIDEVHDVFVDDDTNGYESRYKREAEALRIEARTTQYYLSGRNAIPLTLAEQLWDWRYERGGQVLFGLWSLGLGGQYMPSPQIINLLLPLGMSKRSIYRGIEELDEPDFKDIVAEYHPTDIDVLLSSELDDELTMLRGYNLAQPDNLASLSSISDDYSSQLTMLRGYNLAQHYIPEIPDNVTLLASWGIRTGKNFRLAMMLDLIAQNPRQYSHKELAARTGLKVGTIKSYLRSLRTTGIIESKKMVTVTPLNLQNLFSLTKSIEADERVKRNKKGHYGEIWMQDENDETYPLIRGLAAKLLYEGRQLTLIRQQANFYSVKDKHNS